MYIREREKLKIETKSFNEISSLLSGIENKNKIYGFLCVRGRRICGFVLRFQLKINTKADRVSQQHNIHLYALMLSSEIQDCHRDMEERQ